MNHDYDDIRSRISEEPKWYDENAVPRYVTFSPKELANIYASEAALAKIACQNCQTRFLVAFSLNNTDAYLAAHKAGTAPRMLADSIREKTIHYGDPPNIGCCAAGPAMNSDPLCVVEFWRRDKSTDHEWRRDAALEVDVSD